MLSSDFTVSPSLLEYFEGKDCDLLLSDSVFLPHVKAKVNL